MVHVITERCCNEASCVAVCPVDCIHPRPDEPEYLTAEMLYIDPQACIDCGACVAACPVDAIVADFEDGLPKTFDQFGELNARYYAEGATPPASPLTTRGGKVATSLRVAVVGSGPAAQYAASELLDAGDVSVDMFERLPVPGGLLRYGVAPDHEGTKGVQATFARMRRRPNFRMFLNVEVGVDITAEQLAERYHAVIYAVGARSDRRLGIPGEDLEGSHSATDFVSWYNGHPDFADRSFDLSGERAVVVGNGNVALDVARILAAEPDTLAKTDIADHALEALRSSNIREIVVIGRRGPAEAAFTTPELIDLAAHDDFDVVVDVDSIAAFRALQAEDSLSLSDYKVNVLDQIAAKAAGRDRRVVLKFLASPEEIVGAERVEGVRLSRNELTGDGHSIQPAASGDSEVLDARLVLRAVGYRSDAVEGVPFDAQRGVVPNEDGRVIDPDTGEVVTGAYVAGWIRRGPTGGIGVNKHSALETIDMLLSDHAAGRLRAPVVDAADLAQLLPGHIDAAGARAIEESETTAGAAQARPRVKIVDTRRMLELARPGGSA